MNITANYKVKYRNKAEKFIKLNREIGLRFLCIVSNVSHLAMLRACEFNHKDGE